MAVLLFTDASSKQGYSSYAWRSSTCDQVSSGVYKTMNTAYMEVYAIVQGLNNLNNDDEIIVVTDFMGAASIIANFRWQQGNKVPKIKDFAGDEYKVLCNELKYICSKRNIDCIWLASKAPCHRHLEVDRVSKEVLNEFLRKRK